MEAVRQTVGMGQGQRGGTLPPLETQREGWERKEETGTGRGGTAGGGMLGALGLGGGAGADRGGRLPRLQPGEEGYERQGWGEEAARGGRGGRGGRGRGYDEEEEGALGVPAGSGREKYPSTWSDWWHDWRFGLTYNNSEWG